MSFKFENISDLNKPVLGSVMMLLSFPYQNLLYMCVCILEWLVENVVWNVPHRLTLFTLSSHNFLKVYYEMPRRIFTPSVWKFFNLFCLFLIFCFKHDILSWYFEISKENKLFLFISFENLLSLDLETPQITIHKTF